MGPNAGRYAGLVLDSDGEPVGHIRGIYGNRRNGQPVFFGKFINRDGGFRGIVRGTYDERHFDGRWLDRAGDHGVMAGVYRGPDAIFRFLARLPKETDGTYRSQLVDVLASESRAAALYRASGTRRGRALDLDQVLLFRLADGAVQDVLALPSDPSAFEEFWAR
jgi:ketosteroid isomerase-like protein